MIALILAQVSNRRKGLEYAQEWFSRQDPTIMPQILAVIAILAVGIFIAWGTSRLQARARQPKRAHPMRLYLKLLRRLGLSMAEQWRLWRLARALQLQHPTCLLISPAEFDEAVQRYCGARPQCGAAGTPPAFRTIRARLFPS